MKSNTITLFTLLILSATLILNGCGNSGDFSTAPVRGVVHIEGEPGVPVPFVQVIFQPITQEGDGSAIVGKAGRGVTNENGEFTISTYDVADGAVIGKHEIRIDVSRSTLPDNPANLSNRNVLEVVEVTKGKNEFTFTLPKRNPRQRQMPMAD
ncbi:MAG: hypothetical protein FWG73_04180 [Planctomycetaceae bacterium]|nr:hypothetical protein [Planctomycetaceae bacterium]